MQSIFRIRELPIVVVLRNVQHHILGSFSKTNLGEIAFRDASFEILASGVHEVKWLDARLGTMHAITFVYNLVIGEDQSTSRKQTPSVN
jgi:hypothetical protein